jgi:hypothetical protein
MTKQTTKVNPDWNINIVEDMQPSDMTTDYKVSSILYLHNYKTKN